MKVKDRTLGAWFNRRRFDQRKAKGYRLSRRFDHLLSRWFNHLLFKLLPLRWYLRTQGIKLYHEPRTTVTITYKVLDEVRTARIELLGGARMIVKMLPLWLEHGFCEPIPELSPYIPRHLDNERYYVPPVNILKVAWYDPVLKDYFSVS